MSEINEVNGRPEIVICGRDESELAELRGIVAEINQIPIYKIRECNQGNGGAEMMFPGQNAIWLVSCDFSCRRENCLKRLEMLKKHGCRSLCLLRPFSTADGFEGRYFCSNYSLDNVVDDATRDFLERLGRSSFCWHSRAQLQSDDDAGLMVHEIQGFIHEGPENELSRRQIAERFSVSESWLSASFRKHAGLDLKTYLEREKLCRAMTLAVFSGLALKRVARLLAYHDYRSFWRFFRNKTGWSLAGLLSAHRGGVIKHPDGKPGRFVDTKRRFVDMRRYFYVFQ